MINHHLNHQPWWRRLLRSRLMISINLLLIGFVGWSLFREVNQGSRVSAEYADLQKQISSLEKQNQDYSGVISKLGTSGFVEREARIKLGYQKPGEQVLMLKDAASSVAPPSDIDDASLSNPQKWWRYFFGDK
jgi:cell division protein FtsB